MRLTLIRPNMGRLDHGPYLDEGRMEPLQLGILAALTPPDVECRLYDDRLEQVPYDEATDLVAITVETFTARRAYQVAAEYRKRGVPVVMGGFHATLAPEECQQHADAVYTGDAEHRWHEVVEHARGGRLRPRYDAPVGVPQAGGVRPRRDLFQGKGYLPITLLQFSRGCLHGCEFCAVSAFSCRRHVTRPCDDVVAEIESQGRKLLFFVDDNMLADRQAAKQLLRRLVPLRVRWVSQASLDMTTDPELMQLLADSGCLGNVIGFESVDPASLRAMSKTPNLGGEGWDGYEQACQVLREHGLQTWAAFTLGHDLDTPATIRATLDFAMAHRFCFAAFNILMPYPGTPFHDRLRREGRLLWDGRWWLHPQYRFNHAAFEPRSMSPEALTELAWECRRRWNRPGAILRRLIEPRTNMASLRRLGIYLRYVPLFAREVFRKHGMRLGAAGS